MIRAAVLSVHLLTAAPRPAGPYQPVRTGITRGFWGRLLDDMDGDTRRVSDTAYRRSSTARAATRLSGAHTRRQARGARRERAGASLAAILMLSGCTIAPDTLCQHPKPHAALNDTLGTRTLQAKAAKLWDSRCTVRGWVTP